VGRVVEDQARRVVLIKGRIRPEFQTESRTFVGTEVAAIAIDLIKIRMASEEIAAIGAAMHRIECAQRRVGRVGIDMEGRWQTARIELAHERRQLLSLHYPARPIAARGWGGAGVR